MDDTPTHTGSCLCGGVRLRIAGPLAPVQVCHCVSCRKAQGAPFAANIPVDTAALQLQDEQGLVEEYESTPGKLRAFCRRCGSPIYSRRPDTPGVLRLRAGLLDEPVASAPDAHAFVGSGAGWWPRPDDGLPQFDGARPPGPLPGRGT